jgi:hypothetical protein
MKPKRIRKAIAVKRSAKVSIAEQVPRECAGKKKQPLGAAFSSAPTYDTGQHTLLP